LELPVIVELGGVLYVTLWVYALLRFEDYYHRGQLGNILRPSYEAYFLWVELLLALIIPLVILSFRKARLDGTWLYVAACSTLLGFITNRLNVSITGFETWAGHHYYPRWTEASITAMIIAMGFLIFSLAVKYLPIFEDEHHGASHTVVTTKLAEMPAPMHQSTLTH
jgi:Ni/Fe-hydrogenase subunit HybB-like protein